MALRGIKSPYWEERTGCQQARLLLPIICLSPTESYNFWKQDWPAPPECGTLLGGARAACKQRSTTWNTSGMWHS